MAALLSDADQLASDPDGSRSGKPGNCQRRTEADWLESTGLFGGRLDRVRNHSRGRTCGAHGRRFAGSPAHIAQSLATPLVHPARFDYGLGRAMEIVNFTPVPALVGGLMIGMAAALVYAMNGRIAGISGIVARLMRAVPGDTAWRVVFLVGMVAGGALLFAAQPRFAVHEAQTGWLGLVVAGLLVGLGTRLGGGCTSGHGVCGIPRGSMRSFVATLTFMAFGFATVFVVRHLIGGSL